MQIIKEILYIDDVLEKRIKKTFISMNKVIEQIKKVMKCDSKYEKFIMKLMNMLNHIKS